MKEIYPLGIRIFCAPICIGWSIEAGERSGASVGASIAIALVIIALFELRQWQLRHRAPRKEVTS